MPASERIYRTEAVILRRQDLGEADRILTLYTRDHGKIRVVAKGVKKPTSRKVGHVELFTRADVLIARGRTLDILSQAQTLDAFLPLRQNLEQATYAAHFVELLDAFTEEGDESRALYDLLVEGLGWLCATSDLRRTARYYELRLLGLAGYRPELFRCAACGKEIEPQDQFYSPAAGGVLCPACGPGNPRARPISLNALKVLRYMQTRPFEAVESLTLRPAVQAECERLLHGTLTYYLERRLRSAAFLARLRREAPDR
ncbi:MAG TPA: DNA repair protein RecO [Chloroflexi bacterium]|nr:DNA repair protein RecO [Chloroflexota bacterium]